MSKTILKRTYTAESLCDIEQDVNDSFADIPAEADEHGFFGGTVTVTVEYNEDE